MKMTLALLVSAALAGSAGAQTLIDTSGAHAAPLPAASQQAPVSKAKHMGHALATIMTRAVAQTGPDGRLQAVCRTEPNPPGVAAEAARSNHKGHQE